MKPLRTSDIARATGLHPNTVRKYEEQGYLPPVGRGANGYRQFTQQHLDQIRLIKALWRCTWLGQGSREKAQEAVRHAAGGDFAAARASGAEMLALISEERQRAELAAEYLAGWASQASEVGQIAPEGMNIREAAAYLKVTPHTLRNWDRNRLVMVPRDPSSGYRTYGPAELRRLMVIRALRRARFNLMSILNMFRQLEQDPGIDPRAAIDSLPPGEPDIYYSTNRWLSKVSLVEGCAREALEHLAMMSGRYGGEGASDEDHR